MQLHVHVITTHQADKLIKRHFLDWPMHLNECFYGTTKTTRNISTRDWYVAYVKDIK